MSSRTIAAGLFFVGAVIPPALFAYAVIEANVATFIDADFVELLLSSENEDRGFLLVLFLGAVFSLVAAFIVLFAKRRITMKSVLVGAVCQLAAYAITGAWWMVLVGGAPLWWVYGAMHEV